MLYSPAFVGALGTKPAPVGGGGATLPTIASPFFGLDASAAGMLKTAVGGSTNPSDGGLVGQIKDAFGGALTFDQSDGTQQATYIASGLNSKPVLRFSTSGGKSYRMPGSGDLGLPLKGGVTIAAAIVPRWQGTASNAYVFTAGADYGATLSPEHVAFEISTGPLSVWGIRNTSADYVYVNPASMTYVDAVLYKVVFRYSVGNGLRIRAVMGGTIYDGFTPAGSNADFATWTNVAIGGSPSNGSPQEFYSGDIAELRIWGAEASDAARDSLISYLTSKWG